MLELVGGVWGGGGIEDCNRTSWHASHEHTKFAEEGLELDGGHLHARPCPECMRSGRRGEHRGKGRKAPGYETLTEKRQQDQR